MSQTSSKIDTTPLVYEKMAAFLSPNFVWVSRGKLPDKVVESFWIIVRKVMFRRAGVGEGATEQSSEVVIVVGQDPRVGGDPFLPTFWSHPERYIRLQFIFV